MKKIHTYSCQLLGGLVVLAMFSPFMNMVMNAPDKAQKVYQLFLLSFTLSWGMIGYAVYNIHAERRGHDVLDALVYPLAYAPLAAYWYLRRYLKRQ